MQVHSVGESVSVEAYFSTPINQDGETIAEWSGPSRTETVVIREQLDGYEDDDSDILYKVDINIKHEKPTRVFMYETCYV